MAKIAKSYHSYTCNMLQCSLIPSLRVRPSAGPVCFSAVCRLRRLRKKKCVRLEVESVNVKYLG